jgi:hypothetical protein
MNEIKTIISRLEKQKTGIDRAIGALRKITNGGSAGTSERPAARPSRKERRLSAGGRKRIAEAARRRWAAMKAEQTAGPTEQAVQVKVPAGKKSARKKAPSAAATIAA